MSAMSVWRLRCGPSYLDRTARLLRRMHPYFSHTCRISFPCPMLLASLPCSVNINVGAVVSFCSARSYTCDLLLPRFLTGISFLCWLAACYPYSAYTPLLCFGVLCIFLYAGDESGCVVAIPVHRLSSRKVFHIIYPLQRQNRSRILPFALSSIFVC